MKRSELEHVLRASAAITRESSLRHRMIGIDRLLERLHKLDSVVYPAERLVAWAARRAAEAANP